MLYASIYTLPSFLTSVLLQVLSISSLSTSTLTPRVTSAQAYPLYATIGLGCVGAVLYLGRLALGPDTK